MSFILVFFSLSQLVLELNFCYYSPDNNIEVNIFQLKSDDYYGSEIISTFTYEGHETVIKLSPSNESVSFIYTPGEATINKEKFKVSKLLIFYWIADAGSGSEPPRTTYLLGGDKFNVVFNLGRISRPYLKTGPFF